MINPVERYRSVAELANDDRIAPDPINKMPTIIVQRCDLSIHNGRANKPNIKSDILHPERNNILFLSNKLLFTYL